MEKFIKLESEIVCINADDIDTDQIIPARFLKRTSRVGFEDALFHDLRFHADGSSNQDFPLTHVNGKEKILVAGKNFGCGSSREHAVWALRDFGFRAVVAPSFADIFSANALNNGLLPIVLPADLIEKIGVANKQNKLTASIDLRTQKFLISELFFSASFPIGAHQKEFLMSGLDETGWLLTMKNEILEFERKRNYQEIL
jgi:3-isopropylmalate/(R)-2-methylmalate dehydratase small subunit